MNKKKSVQQNDQPSYTTPESPTIIEKTPESQLPISTTINEIQQKETQPTTNSPTNTTPNNVPHPTMDLTIDDFPTLTPDEIDNQHQIKTIFPTTLWINQLQSSLTILYKLHSKDHAKPLSIAKIISTIKHSPKNNATAPYMSAESYTTTASAISKAMFIELGDHDPSNEYIVNYSDSKTIRLYRKLTEKRVDIETLY